MLNPLAWLLLGVVVTLVVDAALARLTDSVLKGWTFDDQQ